MCTILLKNVTTILKNNTSGELNNKLHWDSPIATVAVLLSLFFLGTCYLKCIHPCLVKMCSTDNQPTNDST